MAPQVHRFWTGPPDPRATWTAAAIRSTGGDLMEWRPTDLELDAEPGADPRHLSNLARYRILHDYGGLYLDHDVIPLTNLAVGTKPWTAGWGRRREGCAMYFPTPGHLLLAELLATIPALGHELPTVDRSGAHLLTAIGARYTVAINSAVLPFDRHGNRVSQQQPTAIHLWQTGAPT